MGSWSTISQLALRTGRALALSCVLAGLACSSSSNEHKDESRVIPPAEVPLGVSYGGWGAAWWKWAFNVPEATNPLLDPTGEFCGQGQQGAVWFLAGNAAGGKTERTCTLPAGKNVFFPIVNAIGWVIPDDPGLDTVEEIRTLLAYQNMNATTSATLDGAALETFRATSDAFTLSLADGNLMGAPAMDIPGCLSDGYWIMLRPLTPGAHTLRFAGEVGS